MRRAGAAAIAGLDATGGAGLDFRSDGRLRINESCDRDWTRQVILVETHALCRRDDQRFGLGNERHGRELQLEPVVLGFAPSSGHAAQREVATNRVVPVSTN